MAQVQMLERDHAAPEQVSDHESDRKQSRNKSQPNGPSRRGALSCGHP
eukprot:CAMPEP_0183554216 /NCGR_PEP_ID=MMETSP0371-20130417/77800_1 /TAXON_ID=268820 /ORGANISM="Peridinium aciculiferum, Strain PAER-2" /LENGTH=47 /DNA_ID= /DNA_START= /DNA_END= /DNA_ORIENTATION=